MEVYSLFSGSSANCTLVRSHTGAILIDAGGSARKISSALSVLGMSFADISAVFVTHEHSDHTAALPMISKKYNIPIHMVGASAERLAADGGCRLPVTPHPPIFSEEICGFTVASFPTSHDSAACVGYTICENGTKIGIATDTGEVTPTLCAALAGCPAVLIEANYDKNMLKNGPYPAALKLRISGAGGHLCNDDCASLAVFLAEQGTKSFLLGHLSAENNRPELAERTVSEALAENSFAGLTVKAAARYDITRMVIEP